MKKFLLVLFVAAHAMTAAVKAQDVNAPINNDPNVRIGTLENGMTYYIRANKKPENKVEFRLAVNAGSNQENDDQRGLAHFTEHMGFNGLKGYPGNAVVSELQKIGVSFGADLNAYTTFDETVYMIQLPSDDPKYLKLGFDILYGWAAGMLMDDKEIDKERGVILEEWRLGLGAQDRMMKKYFPVIFNNSRYAERLPIGLPEILKSFKHQTLKDFYRDWYRPDLQAVIVVGDIDLDATEARIRELMNGIVPTSNPRVKENYPIPLRTSPAAVVCTDPEAMGTQIISYRLFPDFQMKTVGDYQTAMMHELYNIMFDARFSEMLQHPECPFIAASSGYSGFIGACDMYFSYAVCKDNLAEAALKILQQEEHRVLKYGFLESELVRAKSELMERYTRASKEVSKTESAHFASEYVSHFLHKDPIPGAKRALKFAEKFIPEITLEAVNGLSKEWLKEGHAPVFILTAPQKEDVKVPTENDLLAIFNDPSLADVQPYTDDYKETDFVDPDAITEGSMLSSRAIDVIDAKEITLSNGITVILKKTEFKNDEIVFSAKSKGGFSLYPVKDIPSAMFAGEMVDRGGIADMDFTSLEKKMKGKRYGIMPSIGVLSEEFDGSSSPDDLETFFQYLHAYFTHIRTDSNAYQVVLNQYLTQKKMIEQNPMYKFFGSFVDASTQSNPYASNILTMKEETIQSADYERAVQIFRERFANPADFVFVFVGNFEEEKMEQYLKKYVASLPTKAGEKESFNASVVANTFPATQVQHKVVAGTEDQSWVGLAFEAPFPYDAKNNMIVTEIGDAMDIELTELIREKLGGTYSPMIYTSTSKHPTETWSTVIMFSCSPAKAEKLTGTVLKYLQQFQAKGPKAETLEKVQKQLLNAHTTRLETNGFWLNYMATKYFEDEQQQIDMVNSYNERVNAVTLDDIKHFMQAHFNPNHYVRVTLLPEKSGKGKK
jgi:zinc protease